MTKSTKSGCAAAATMLAAKRFSRRTMLKAGAAAGALTIAGPALVRNARSSSGELNLLMWSDEFPNPVIPNFESKTGIKVNQTPFSQNEEQINKLATDAQGFDLCQPTRDRSPQFKDLGVLGPFDMGKLKNAGNLIPSMLEGSSSVWTWDGGLYHLPHVWGSEALSWRTDKWQPKDPAQLSYGDLWGEDVKGHVQGRPHSLLLGIGLWMDGTGKLPTNRMADAFKDEESFKKIYDQILPFAIEHKPWIKAWWDSADNTKSNLLENDVWLGQTWDGPALSLKKDGKPVTYQAPKEGAITWLDGLSMIKDAKNSEQIYAFLDYMYTPEVAAQVAEGSGYNPVVTGADALTSDTYKKNFQEAYPGDSLKNLWHRIPEPSWFGELRTQYADKFQAA